MASTKIQTFKVKRKTAELISPSQPTPHEFKYLSDIDDQDSVRCYVPFIHFYRNNPSIRKDPVKIIRDAIAKALVFYYPLAGRLREYDGRKLVVECTGEGAVFVEADADVMLHQFGDALYPPFPNLDDLLFGMHNVDSGIINRPLLLIQVTRLKCGGFIIGSRHCHAMCDGYGIFRILSAVGELARGAAAPSIPPVWERHLLTARRPPRVSLTHPEYDVVAATPVLLQEEMVERSFFFSTADISALRRTLPPHLQSCSKFVLVAACSWRCRTIALSPKPDEETRFMCAVDIRKRMEPPLPAGYYGNVVGFPTTITTAAELSNNPLAYAVELVRETVHKGTGEYLRSVADLMVTRDRPGLTAAMTYRVSNLTQAGFEKLDVGWGTAAYGGVAKIIYWIPIQISWYIPYQNKSGEQGIVVPAYLPSDAMVEFAKQLQITITAGRNTTSAL